MALETFHRKRDHLETFGGSAIITVMTCVLMPESAHGRPAVLIYRYHWTVVVAAN